MRVAAITNSLFIIYSITALVIYPLAAELFTNYRIGEVYERLLVFQILAININYTYVYIHLEFRIPSAYFKYENITQPSYSAREYTLRANLQNENDTLQCIRWIIAFGAAPMECKTYTATWIW